MIPAEVVCGTASGLHAPLGAAQMSRKEARVTAEDLSPSKGWGTRGHRPKGGSVGNVLLLHFSQEKNYVTCNKNVTMLHM